MLTVAGMPETKKDEVRAFARRLESLLLKKGSTLSPTALARDFNLRWRGVPVTVNATRKWLMGQAMPTMDKIAVLANMLNTSQDWLRFGDSSLEDSDNRSYAKHLGIAEHLPRDEDKTFAQDFKLLNASNKRVVAAVMEVLLKEQQLPGVKEKASDSLKKNVLTVS
jgi:transcriptional regulator with XRE-family HTH domain